MGLSALMTMASLAIFIAGTNAEISQRSSAQDIDGQQQQPVVVASTTASTGSAVDNWRKDCSKAYSSTCLKLDVVSFVDRLAEQDNLGILPGVSVVKQNGSGPLPAAQDVVANLAREFPHDADKRMDAYLMHKIGSYLNSHAISIRLFDPRTFEAARSFNEAALEQLGWFSGGEQRAGSSSRGSGSAAESARKKDKGGMNALLAGLMMMKGTLGALGFGALAMLAGKALMTGLMALMLSAIVGLKSLASGGDKKTTYEIVSKPVYSASHSHSSEDIHHGAYAGYGRSLQDAAESVHEAIKKYGNVRNRRTL